MDSTDTGTLAMPDALPRPQIVSGAGLKDEFLRFMPVWFVYLSAVGLHAALANFPEDGFVALGLSRMDFVPTIVFPMIWFVGFFVLRIRRSGRLENRW